MSPLIRYEQGGPGLYFMVDSPSGERLLEEAKAEGSTIGRVDAKQCSYVELCVTAAPLVAA